MPNWFHGTNQHFDSWEIDESIQGMNTQAFSAREAIFLTNCPHLASHYSYSAANSLYEGDHRKHVDVMEALGRKYDRELNRRQFDAADQTCVLMEEYESKLQSDRSGQCVYGANIITDNVKTIDFGGKEWGGEEMVALLEHVQSLGLDVLIVNNTVDRPTYQVNLDPISIAVVFNARALEFSIGIEKRGIVPKLPKVKEFNYAPIEP